MSTLDGPIWSKCSMALTCPASHISSAHRAGKDEARVEMNVIAYQEEKNRDEYGQERENRRPILKKLCAALLRSFRGQHGEKMKGSAWDRWKGQQPFRPNPNGVGDRTTRLRRLLIGADWKTLGFFVAYFYRFFSALLLLLTST